MTRKKKPTASLLRSSAAERAVQFRKWATRVVEEFTIEGFAMDDERQLSDVPVRQWVLSVPHEPGGEHLNNYLEYEFVFE